MKRDYFYPTNVAPLWTGCFDPSKKEYYLKHVLSYLQRSQVCSAEVVYQHKDNALQIVSRSYLPVV